MILDSMDQIAEKQTNDYIRKWKDEFFGRAENVIQPFRNPNAKGYEAEFMRILDQVLELDKEISR